MTPQLSPTVAPPADSTVLVATYLECFSTATDEVATRLSQEREATRGDPGLTWCEFLQRLDRPMQLLALSVWSTEQALETHRRTRHVVDLNQALAPVLATPADSRHHQRFAHYEARPPSPTGLWVVTHVDVAPPHKDAAMVELEQLAAHSATEEGNGRFLVWQQRDRPNHFTLVETWTDLDALATHAQAAATMTFRRTIAPLLGALYDDRWYQTLP